LHSSVIRSPKKSCVNFRSFDLSDRVILITGGSRGLGLVLAREFAELSPRIAVCARDEKELGQVRSEFAWMGERFMAIGCDTTQRYAVGKYGAAR
jgi:short-subunit dehydrogenase involved in D-alanine esterification of teichoic acids